MPRDGANIYNLPFPNVSPSTTIESTVYNGFTNDIAQDLNAPRPIVAGGTGASSAAAALAALGGETAFQQVTNYDSYAFKAGSFYSTDTATASPVAGHWFFGTAIAGPSGNSITLEARDLSATPPLKYVRIFNGTTWGAWQLSTVADGAVAKAGDIMTGDLTISKSQPSISLNKTASGQNNIIYGTLNGTFRWAIALGDSTSEPGSNSGSNFSIYRYTDAGAFLATAFSIERINGRATFNADVNANGDVTVKAASPSGTLFFGNSGSKYLQYDGTSFNFSGDVAVRPPSANLTNASGAFNVSYRGNGSQHGMIMRTTADGGVFTIGFEAANSAIVGSIQTTGSATIYGTSSDARLKEDLKPFDAGRIIDDTMVYNFSWKRSGGRGYGVIAQEAIEVYPDAVAYCEMEDWWGVDYSKYVPLLLAEIKALRARVATLEAR